MRKSIERTPKKNSEKSEESHNNRKCDSFSHDKAEADEIGDPWVKSHTRGLFFCPIYKEFGNPALKERLNTNDSSYS